jgi:hypothetical protein
VTCLAVLVGLFALRVIRGLFLFVRRDLSESIHKRSEVALQYDNMGQLVLILSLVSNLSLKLGVIVHMKRRKID